MRLHRFFVEEQLRNKKNINLLDDGIIHQLKDVFRLHAGDRLILLDNSGFEFLAETTTLAKSGAEMKILEETRVENIPKKDVWLFAALIKKDNFEWILEKGTELGVSHFVPILSDRSEKKDINSERALKIIKEASEQSGRGVMPILHEILKLEDVFDFSKQKAISLIAFNVSRQVLSSQDQSFKSLEIQGFIIGPEGGWTDREIELFKSHNTPTYSLGPQVLRAETAAIAVSALLLL